MIDKEKLLKEMPCLKEGCCHSVKTCKNRIDGVYQTQTECIASAIKNFPEEPAIDFDQLYKEYSESHQSIHLQCFIDFLKSKNLTQPTVDMDALRNAIYTSIQKPREIPVKKYWALKKDYNDYHVKFCKGVTVIIKCEEEPKHPEFYDYHEEVDISKIPKDSIVEMDGGAIRTVVSTENGKLTLRDFEACVTDWNLHKIIRVVEWGDDVK